MVVFMNIGYFLKKIRLDKKVTLTEVANKINLTASLLSQIENGKISPSLNSLEAILGYYRMNLCDFFKQVEQKKYLIARDKDTETLEDPPNGIKYTLLASKLENNTLESYLIELNPEAKISVRPASAAENSERFIWILDGSVEIKLEDENLKLDKNDSLNFKAHMCCEIKNLLTGQNSVLFVNGIPGIF